MGKEKSTSEENQNSLTKNPPKLILAAIMLTAIFAWLTGPFFYDYPQLFEEMIISKFKISTVKVGLIYTVSSAPTFLLTPLITFLVDRIGKKLGLFLLSSCMFFGIFITYIGVSTENYYLMLGGRALFGPTYESGYVVAISCLEQWFTGKILSIAFSINLTTCNLIIWSATYFLPSAFVKSRNLQVPFFIYGVFGFFCCIMAVGYYYFDSRYGEDDNDKDDEEKEEKIEVKDLKKIGLLPWLMLVLYAVVTNCTFQFTNIATDCLVKRFGFGYLEAKNRLSIMPILNTILYPLFSVIITKVGKKGFLLVLANIIVILAYGFLSTLGSNGDEKVLIGIIGISTFQTLLVSSFWSSFSLILPKQAITVMFGLVITIQNIFLALFPPIFSYLSKERTPSAYQKCLHLLIGIAVVSLTLNLVICFKDFKGNQAMHLPENNENVKKNKERLNREFSDMKKLLRNADKSSYTVSSGVKSNVDFASLVSDEKF